MGKIKVQKIQRLALAVSILVLGMHLAPFLWPTARLWGINHLLFLPPYGLYLYAAVAVAVLLMFLHPFRTWAAEAGAIPAAALFEHRYRRRWLLAAAVCLAVFWVGRMPLVLLGDSYSVTANIGNELPVIYKWSETGAIYLAYFLSRLLPYADERLGQLAYGLISVVSGAATVFIFFLLAYELAARAAGRMFVFCLSVCAGWMLLFFGYTENYPVLWPLVSGYLYFSVRYLKGYGRIIGPTVFLLVGLVMHLQVLFFLLSYPVLIMARRRPASSLTGYRLILLVVAAAVVLLAALMLLRQYRDVLELTDYLIPMWRGHPSTPHYALLSPAHGLDFVNQLLLLVPMLPVLLVLGWRRPSRFFADKVNLFLIVFSLGGLAFAAVIDPKLGMARDWDLFALAGLGPMLLLAKNIVVYDNIHRSLYPALTCAAFITAAPFVAVNLSPQPAVDNFKFLLNLDLPRSRTAIVLLRDIYEDRGDSAAVDSLNGVLEKNFPAIRYVSRGYELADGGRADEAMILVDSLALIDPASTEFYSLRGYVYFKQGRYAQAIRDLERAARLGRYDARPLARLGAIYRHTGQYERMIEALRRGLKRNPDDRFVLLEMMQGYYLLHQYDSALVYSQKVIERHPNYPGAHLIAGYSALELGDPESAVVYLTRFLTLVPDYPSREQILDLLEKAKLSASRQALIRPSVTDEL